MTYIALGSDGVGDLGTVLVVLNFIALGVFFFTLCIDRITRGVDRLLGVLHRSVRPHRSTR